MSLRALAEAAQIASDNTAANLLLARLGGPSGFTAQLREIGDAVTRLDRNEPEMNYVRPGEERDTTTPAAMAQTTLTLITGDALTPASRAVLLDWMRRTETGARRLRAGLPPEWNAGDKTGTGWYDDLANKYNDVAIAFPPGGSPVAIAAYYEGPGPFPNVRPEDEAVLAQVGRIAAELV
jgi:beta-lactamase class A